LYRTMPEEEGTAQKMGQQGGPFISNL